MDIVLSYRGRQVTEQDVVFIGELLTDNPTASRRALSKKLCEAWNWTQPNGSLKDMVCRGLMLQLHRAGHIELPPVRRVPNNPLARRRKPAPVQVDTTPLGGSVADLGPLRFVQVRRQRQEPLFDGLIQTWHYLGYTQPVGEHLKFLVLAGDRPVACFVWNSAPRHLGPRDRHIGWSAQARRRNISMVACNSRFLIMPWVQVPNLASHLLGRMTRMLPQQWRLLYGHPVHFAETFVDPRRFAGTCYLAANWTVLGQTTGRGHNDRTNRCNQPRKQVLGLALTRRFRKLLEED